MRQPRRQRTKRCRHRKERTSATKRVLGAAGTFVALALVAAAVWFMCFSPYKVYVVHTGSMEPTIPVGSAEIVRVGEYHVGQVVTYRFHGTTVTHRLVSVAPDGLITTKGDANPTVDPWHEPTSAIVGQVVAAPQYVGWWLVYFQQPLGVTSAVLALFIIWFLWDWLNELPLTPEPA